MDAITDFLPLVLTMLAAGAVAGVLAGMLGVGGGIVIVPVLEMALGLHGVDPAIRMHIAVATSLATIIPTSISSSRAHHGRGAVDWGLVKYWGPFIVVGALLGTLLAAQVEGAVLSTVFAVVAFVVAIKLVLPLDDYHPWPAVPRGAAGAVTPTVIGGLSTMMGIGGGTLSVAALTLMSQSIHRAVGTAAFFGLLISVPGMLGYVVSGWGDPRLPVGNIGYVNLIGFALISVTTVLTAPLGAKIAHRLSRRHLSMAFGLFLLAAAVRMLLQAMT